MAPTIGWEITWETGGWQVWGNDKRKQLNEQYLASLMGRYDVTIEDVPVDEKSGQETVDKTR